MKIVTEIKKHFVDYPKTKIKTKKSNFGFKEVR